MGITSVLDEFHLQKYLMKMTGHMEDSTEDARKTLCHVVKSGTKEDFREVVDRLKDCAKQKEQKNELMRAPLISSRTGQRQKSV